MPKVRGIERFAEAMRDCSDDYVLIGGGACSILFDDEQLPFRVTKDLDVVVIADGDRCDFARALWHFVKEEGYISGRRQEGKCAYYRFTLPEDAKIAKELPAQIELFARHPEFALADEQSEVAPLPFDETVSSLSAIILDEGYFEFIRDNRLVVDGVTTLDAAHIIPLKMRANVDINRSYAEGRNCNAKALKKHRGDVTKLAGLLPASARLKLAGQMREDAEVFFMDFEQYAGRQTRAKERDGLLDTLAFLRRVYL